MTKPLSDDLRSRTIETLWTAIADAIPKITAVDCQAFFNAAGYGSV